MPKKQLILNGDNIATISDFYDEVQNVLTNDFRHFGRNLDALNDVLRAGF